jgi:quercetin dioxygenase-like cupin family protein
METVSKPNVKSLAEGAVFKTKQMKASAGKLLPKHRANVESVVVVTKGEIEFRLTEESHSLKQGDVFVVPAKAKHQIKVVEDFAAIHIMPHEIEFEYFKE